MIRSARSAAAALLLLLPTPALADPNDSAGSAGPNQPTTVDVTCPGDLDHTLHYNLCGAAINGNLGALKSCLDAGACINYRSYTEDNATPVMLAAMQGHAKVVKELATRGAELEAEGHQNATALIYAVTFKHNEAVKALLAAGANPNTLTYSGATALMVASTEGNTSMAKTLLEAGADPNVAFSGRVTPLLLAVQAQKKDMVKLLLAKGADVNRSGPMGITPLATAAAENYLELAKILLEAGGLVYQEMSGDYAGMTALTVASANGNTDMVKLLQSAKQTP